MNKFKELIPYIIILILVILFRTFIATPIRVNGPSMDATLKDGEIMVLNKLGKLEQGKIVVVDIKTERVIKRIIGMPGDTVECINGIIYVNDKALDEDYTSSETIDFTSVELEKNEYFVMGDNRSVSLDSRSFGPVSKEDILGTTNLALFPLSKIGIVK